MKKFASYIKWLGKWPFIIFNLLLLPICSVWIGPVAAARAANVDSCSINQSKTQNARFKRIDPNEYYYIRSRLDGFVLDVLFNGTNPGTQGIPIDVFPQKTPPADNQLWRFVPDGNGDGYCFIESRSSLFLDVYHDNRDPGTQGIPVIAFSQDAGTAENQVWTVLPNGCIESKSGLFLDVYQSQTNQQASIIAFSKDDYRAPNQHWTIDKSGEVVQDSPGA